MICGKISCPVHHEDGREFEITPEGRVWSCCYFANGWDKRHHIDNEDTRLLMNDPEIKRAFEEDPNWNSLDHYTLAEILEHPVLKDYIYKSGWLSNNPPGVCVKECSIEIDETTGKSKGKSELVVNNYI